MALLTINGQSAPSPSEMQVELFDVGSFGERSASGGLVADRVAVKRRLKLRWACLTWAQMKELLAATEGVFFQVAYPDPETAAVRSADCRCERRSADLRMLRDGRPVWTDVEMEWVER